VPFEKINLGDTISVSRTLSVPEVESLGLVGGDVDAFHIEDDQGTGPKPLEVKSVSAEALISGLLNRRLPGPGSSIVAQNLTNNF